VAVVDFGRQQPPRSACWRDMRVIYYTRDFCVRGPAAHRGDHGAPTALSMERSRAVPRKKAGLPSNYQPEVLDPFIDDMTQTGQPFPAVLPGIGQRPLAARPDFDLRRMRQHSRSGGGHFEPRRRTGRQGRSARQHESVVQGQGASGRPRRHGITNPPAALALRSFD